MRYFGLASASIVGALLPLGVAAFHQRQGDQLIGRQPKHHRDVRLLTEENAGTSGCYSEHRSFNIEGLKLYSWWSDANNGTWEERCIGVRVPSNAHRPMPVMLNLDCYDHDFKLPGDSELLAYDLYGVAQIILGAPLRHTLEEVSLKPIMRGDWLFPNKVNLGNPQQCEETDSPDIGYMETVMSYVASNEQFNQQNIYISGFSQSSMFAAYVGFCFSTRIAGIFQHGSGLVVPEFQGTAGGCGWKGYANKIPQPCNHADGCGFWPIYPCRDPASNLVSCGMAFSEDYCSDSHTTMYNAVSTEGYDSRMVILDGHSFKGYGHAWVNPMEAWQVACLQMTPSCSESCENDFMRCMTKKLGVNSSGLHLDSYELLGRRASMFYTCFGDDATSKRPHSCASGCAPTLNMLKMTTRGKPEIRLTNGDTFDSNVGHRNPNPHSKCRHKR